MPTPSRDTPLPADAPLPARAPTRATEQPADRRLPEAALRALAEAAERRVQRGNSETGKAQAADESGGRGGLDPTRYGDWEVNGLASDF
jgi:hypothetical protein